MSRTRRSASATESSGIVALEDLGLDLGELLLGEDPGAADHREQVERDAVRRLRSFEGRHGGPPRTSSRRPAAVPRCPLNSRREARISECLRIAIALVTMTIPHRERPLNRRRRSSTVRSTDRSTDGLPALPRDRPHGRSAPAGQTGSSTLLPCAQTPARKILQPTQPLQRHPNTFTSPTSRSPTASHPCASHDRRSHA